LVKKIQILFYINQFFLKHSLIDVSTINQTINEELTNNQISYI